MVDAFAVVAFIVGGVPLALTLVRGAQALLAAAAITGVVATIAGIIHVAIDIPIAVIWAILLVLCYLVVASVPALRQLVISNARSGLKAQDIRELAVVAAVLVVVSTLVPAPLAWDARSIWLFHASWLNASSSAYLNAAPSSEMAFSHPDYPILGPASMATVWGIAGGAENLTLGIQTTTVIAVLVVGLAGSIAIRHFAPQGNPVLTTAAMLGFVGAALAVADGRIDEGYMDAMQACFVVALAAQLFRLLRARASWDSAALAAVLAIGAISVKQEGFWFTVIILCAFLLVTVRSQSLAKYLPLAAAVSFYGVWKIFLAVVKARDTSDAAGVVGRFPELVDRGSLAWSIIVRIVTNEIAHSVVPLLIALIVAMGAALIAKRGAFAKEMVFLAITVLGILGTIVLTYALGNTRNQLDWWVVNSFSRVVGTDQLLTWLAVLIAVVVLAPWKSRQTSAPGISR